MIYYNAIRINSSALLRGVRRLQNVVKNYEDVDSWKTIMFLYTSALKEVGPSWRS